MPFFLGESRRSLMSTPPRPRLDLHSPEDNLVAAVGPGAGLAFAREHFPKASGQLLIATAYFSVGGFGLIRDLIPSTTSVRILVGKEEKDRRAVQEVVLQEVRRELQGVATSRLAPAVEAVIARIEAGRLWIAEARGVNPRYHCKFYLASDTLAWHGSANLSLNGLRNQAEQAHAVADPAVIRQWRAWFDDVAGVSVDLTGRLLAALRGWLGMAAPFDAYLAALAALFENREPERRAGAHEPVHFQRALASWGVRQVRRHRGALFVVSTGLGKTVIGAELAGMLATEDVDRVLLVAPSAVHDRWRREIEGRRVALDTFDNGLLFRKGSENRGGEVARLDRRVAEAGPRTLVLIDEAHGYRNQVLHASTEGRSARALGRVRQAAEQGAPVVLMTGSAYATDLQNLLSLLHLLPPTSPPRPDALPLGAQPWEADSPGAFAALPVVAVLGYPHVLRIAERRGDHDDHGPYLPFQRGREYVPTAVRSRIVPYALPSQEAASRAFDLGAFASKHRRPMKRWDDDQGAAVEDYSDLMQNVALSAWMSSPRAFEAVVRQTIHTASGEATRPLDLEEMPRPNVDLFGEPTVSEQSGTGYDATFRLDQADRQRLLEPLLPALRQRSDDKAKRLASEIRALRRGSPLKVIVFVEYLATALHVTRQLRERVRGLLVETTVKRKDRTPALKAPAERAYLRGWFSPRSNGLVAQPDSPDVLVCTDADGVGVNLQDASVVVVYDLPAGADGLIQRLGRILRPSPDPARALTVLTLVPEVALAPSGGGVGAQVATRFARLRRRQDSSKEILGSGVLPPEGETDATLSLRGPVDVAAALTAEAASEQTTPMAVHLEVLGAHREAADRLAGQPPLHTSRVVSHPTRLVAVFRAGRRVHAVVADPGARRTRDLLVSDDDAVALSLLACPPDAPRAPAPAAPPERIVRETERAIRAWCAREGVEVGDVERIAAVYLVRGISTAPPRVV